MGNVLNIGYMVFFIEETEGAKKVDFQEIMSVSEQLSYIKI